MKALKIIGLTLAGIIALILITGLFVNGKYAVVREVTINKSKQEVFDYVKYLKNQRNFSVWAKIDPVMKTEFRGEDGTVGFVSAWDSENPDVGKGEQKIIGLTNGERIDYELHFIEPFESTDFAYMSTKTVSENKTKVEWGFNGKMKYPMNLMLIFMNMEKMLAPDLENGLNNLKNILEQ
ncbi:MAG TPA: SRPBCC family protein [Prolixibacteraceae bacterium]|nr:SRPBCC family protein [Prolixibacteraceae bacterium]